MRYTTRILAVLLLAGPACVSFEIQEYDDPRMGDLGRVRFLGGGCSGSTTLATGATVALTLEPQTTSLPAGLTVVSADPTVIDAAAGDGPDQIELHAVDEGAAYVELRAGGERFDGLEFASGRAAEVVSEAPDAAFSGGTVLVAVSEVRGACGEDCPLIGWGFLDWSGTSADFAVVEEREGWSAFLVSAADGDAVLVGLEPVGQEPLVEHLVTVVAPSAASELEAEVLVMLPDETLLDPRLAPLDVPSGSLFQVKLYATADDGPYRVLLPTFDHRLTLEVGEASVEPAAGDESLDGPVFVARDPGEVRWAVEVPLLGWTRTVSISVVE